MSGTGDRPRSAEHPGAGSADEDPAIAGSTDSLVDALRDDAERRLREQFRRIEEAMDRYRAALERSASVARDEDDATGAAGGQHEGRGGVHSDAAGGQEEPRDEPERSRHDARGEPPADDQPPAQAAGRRLRGPHLVAAQMALAGSTRAEVAEHLKRTFDLPGAQEIAAEVFADR